MGGVFFGKYDMQLGSVLDLLLAYSRQHERVFKVQKLAEVNKEKEKILSTEDGL